VTHGVAVALPTIRGDHAARTIGGPVKLFPSTSVLLFTAAAMLLARPTSAQQADQSASASVSLALAGQQANVPAAVQQAGEAAERVARRFGIGIEGGVALDPELIMFGAHGTFRPIFIDAVSFRPGIEFGVGEVTTTFGINLDVIYTLPGATTGTRWLPYVGGGPNFALSHQGFSNTDPNQGNRFDFSDTSFDGGFNFIAGARSQGRMFVEMKATAYGVANVKLLAGVNF
jgi:hypothetical protein